MIARGQLQGPAPVGAYAPAGHVTAAAGTMLKAWLPNVRIGEICRIGPLADPFVEAEVVGFARDEVLLSPFGTTRGLPVGAPVRGTGAMACIAVGDALLGRVVDARGHAIDGGPALDGAMMQAALHAAPPSAMDRAPATRRFDTGLRVIDGMLTCAKGQRMGIFGSAGAGKSTLLASIVRQSRADLCVVALVGERGREVREFTEHALGAEAMAHSVVVAATSDRPAGERIQAAFAATSIAEHFRDRGRDVLLVVDSLTRLARGQREVGLAAGEMPVRRGFPGSSFSCLPPLLERAGTAGTGSITAFFTVLTEDGDDADPVEDEVRGILDGHLVLSPELAARGHYPAIDVRRSKSRMMTLVTDADHRAEAQEVGTLLAAHDDVAFLVRVGEYVAGSDLVADRALARFGSIEAFLRQGPDEAVGFDDTRAALAALIA